MHVTSKLIELDGPGCSGLVKFFSKIVVLNAGQECAPNLNDFVRLPWGLYAKSQVVLGGLTGFIILSAYISMCRLPHKNMITFFASQETMFFEFLIKN